MIRKISNLFREKIFRHLLIKQMTLILVPVIILVLLVAAVLFNSLYASTCDNIQSVIDTTLDDVGYTLGNLDSICIAIDQSEELIPSLLSINTYSRVKVKNLISDYTMLDAMYKKLMVFFPQTPHLIYSCTGTQPLSTLSKYSFRDNSFSLEEQLYQITEKKLYSDLTATDTSPLSASQLLHSHSFLYVCSAGSLSNNSLASAFLQVDTSDFYNAFGNVFQKYDSHDYAMITADVSGNIIGMTGSLIDRDEMISPQWLAERSAASDVVCFESRHPQFTNYLLLDRSVISASLQLPRQVIGYIIAGIILIAFIVSILSAKHIYRPIARLHNDFFTSYKDIGSDSSELQSIDQAITNIVLSHNKQKEQLSHVLDLIRQQLIFSAIKNDLPRTENIANLLHMAGLDLPNRLFCAFAIELPAGMSQQQTEALCQDIQHTDWNSDRLTAICIPDQHILCVVFHMFVELDSGTRLEYMASALHLLMEQYDITSGIGIGISQPTLFTLHRSYITARRALSASSTPFLLFEDIQEERDDQFTQCLHSLISSINDEPEDAPSKLDQCIDCLTKLASNRPLATFYTARLINEISSLFIHLGIWEPTFCEKEIERLMCAELPELSEKLHLLIRQISVYSARPQQSEDMVIEDKLLQHIHDYLVENALDPMLNINLVTEKFGVSNVSINRRFRRYYGCTMSKFVSDLRIEKAKSYLQSSDMSVKDIVTAVGYFDVPNFTRKFKTVVGETPSQYRRRIRSNDPSVFPENDDESENSY